MILKTTFVLSHLIQYKLPCELVILNIRIISYLLLHTFLTSEVYWLNLAFLFDLRVFQSRKRDTWSQDAEIKYLRFSTKLRSELTLRPAPPSIKNRKASPAWLNEQLSSFAITTNRQSRPATLQNQVELRCNRNHRIVSYPPAMRFAQPGDQTGFRHLEQSSERLIQGATWPRGHDPIFRKWD